MRYEVTYTARGLNEPEFLLWLHGEIGQVRNQPGVRSAELYNVGQDPDEADGVRVLELRLFVEVPDESLEEAVMVRLRTASHPFGPSLRIRVDVMRPYPL